MKQRKMYLSRMQLSLSEEVEEVLAGRLLSPPCKISLFSHSFCNVNFLQCLSRIMSGHRNYQTFAAAAREAGEHRSLVWESRCWWSSSRGWSFSSKSCKLSSVLVFEIYDPESTAAAIL